MIAARISKEIFYRRRRRENIVNRPGDHHDNTKIFAFGRRPGELEGASRGNAILRSKSAGLIYMQAEMIEISRRAESNQERAGNNSV